MFLINFRHSQMTAKKNIGLFFSTAAKATMKYTIKTVSQLMVQTNLDKIISNIVAFDKNGIDLYNKEFFGLFGYNGIYNDFYHQNFIKRMLEVQESFPNCDVTGKVNDFGCIVNYKIEASILPQEDQINIEPSNMAGDMIPWLNIYL